LKLTMSPFLGFQVFRNSEVDGGAKNLTPLGLNKIYIYVKCNTNRKRKEINRKKETGIGRKGNSEK